MDEDQTAGKMVSCYKRKNKKKHVFQHSDTSSIEATLTAVCLRDFLKTCSILSREPGYTACPLLLLTFVMIY